MSEPRKQARTALGRLLERFLHTEASSGIALMIAAVFAIAWANSPWGDSYRRLWERPIGPVTLRFAIDEVLMVLFFFVVGLEVRREIHAGELSEPRRAALPVVAALGGMVVPALLYRLCNPRLPARNGWGVPTATDIAFAVGALALLGRRVPSSLRVLLLALAIIDDIGAIVLIAVFYSSGVEFTGLFGAGAMIAIVLLMQRARISRPFAYLLPGVGVWLGLHHAGIHPTMAGVIMGLLTPPRGDPSPLDRLVSSFHPWVAFAVMPLFALANAGVVVHPVEGAESTITFGVALALVVGKPVGILFASFVAARAGLVSLPRRVTWSGLAVVGLVAGIGFTMSIFIAGLAFAEPRLLDAAKLGILGASIVAGAIGLVFGRIMLKPPSEPDVGPSEAEASTLE